MGTILSVPADYLTIQEAVDHSVVGDTILVAEGEYIERVIITTQDLTLASLFLQDSLEQHISNTRIVCNFDPDSTNRPLTLADSLEGTFRLVGLTLAGGEVTNGYGGGFRARYSTVILEHCHFESNSANRGSGASLWGCDGEITNCAFSNNTSTTNGGGLGIDRGTYCVVNNRFINNIASSLEGGGLASGSSSGTLRGNTFVNNWSKNIGGGADIYGSITRGSWTIVNNRFLENESAVGGGLSVMNMVFCRIDSNYFDSNYAERDFDNGRMGAGGGLWLNAAIDSVICSYNTFIHNYTNGDAAAMGILGSYEFHHNIFLLNMGCQSSGSYAFHGNDPEVLAHGHHNLYIRNQNYSCYSDRLFYNACVGAALNSNLTLCYNDFYYQNGPAAAQEREYPEYSQLDVFYNYWGDPSGPYQAAQNPDGLGDTVAIDTDVIPFETEPCTPWLPPQSFDLVFPSENEIVVGDTVVFRWQPSFDANEEDDLTYRVEIANNPSFTNADTTLIVNDTVLVVPDFPQNEFTWWRVRVRDPLTLEAWSTTTNSFVVVEDFMPETDDGLPTEFAIKELYPNPFNASARIVVAVPQPCELHAAVYDVLGREVAVLASGSVERGYRGFTWTPEGASGLYLLALTNDLGWTTTRKLFYVK